MFLPVRLISIKFKCNAMPVTKFDIYMYPLEIVHK